MRVEPLRLTKLLLPLLDKITILPLYRLLCSAYLGWSPQGSDTFLAAPGWSSTHFSLVHLACSFPTLHSRNMNTQIFQWVHITMQSWPVQILHFRVHVNPVPYSLTGMCGTWSFPSLPASGVVFLIQCLFQPRMFPVISAQFTSICSGGLGGDITGGISLQNMATAS